jgi:hypothetical protein
MVRHPRVRAMFPALATGLTKSLHHNTVSHITYTLKMFIYFVFALVLQASSRVMVRPQRVAEGDPTVATGLTSPSLPL